MKGGTALLGSAAVVAVLMLGACGEKPQTNAEGVKHDAAPWTGTGKSSGTAAAPNGGTVFTAPGWKVGDKKSWEEQLKTRTQNGQNEYTRTQ